MVIRNSHFFFFFYSNKSLTCCGCVLGVVGRWLLLVGARWSRSVSRMRRCDVGCPVWLVDDGWLRLECRLLSRDVVVRGMFAVVTCVVVRRCLVMGVIAVCCSVSSGALLCLSFVIDR